MSTRSIKSPIAVEETPARETPVPVEEGIGVFRGLWLTVLFYLVVAFVIWFAWHAWKQGRVPRLVPGVQSSLTNAAH